MDVISSFNEKGLEVIVLVNLYHLNALSREAEKHRSYFLEYNHRNYSNRFTMFPGMDNYNALSYLIPSNDLPVERRDGTPFTFTLYNTIQKRVYRNVRSCAILPTPPTHDLTICAYVSPFNPIEELYHWVAYYQLHNVTKFILYLGEEYPEVIDAMKEYVKRDIVEFIDWTWPTAGVVWKKTPQRERQASQAMACFYRYRWVTNYMIQCDLDEYVFANGSKRGLLIPIQEAFARWPGKNALLVRSVI